MESGGQEEKQGRRASGAQAGQDGHEEAGGERNWGIGWGHDAIEDEEVAARLRLIFFCFASHVFLMTELAN